MFRETKDSKDKTFVEQVNELKDAIEEAVGQFEGTIEAFPKPIALAAYGAQEDIKREYSKLEKNQSSEAKSEEGMRALAELKKVVDDALPRLETARKTLLSKHMQKTTNPGAGAGNG